MIRSFVVGTALVALCSGCPTTALHGATRVWQQVGYGLNTVQSCSYDPRVLICADQSLIMLLRMATDLGHAPDYMTAAETVGSPAVCIVPRPEPCCASTNSHCLPYGDVAGCAGDGWAWVSATSVGHPENVPPFDWSGTVMHEMGHIVGAALGIADIKNESVWMAMVDGLQVRCL